jgi:N-acyl-D-amino-acid deacylase
MDVAHEVAASGRFISFHIRNEDERLLESLEEALTIARESKAKAHIGHLKTFRRANWHKIDQALDLLDGARRGGMDLTVDRYPHLAMNTQLKFILPTWALEGGTAAVRHRLLAPRTRGQIVAELERTVASETGEVLISLVGRVHNKPLEGRFLDDIAQGKNPWEVTCDLLADEGDAAYATFFGMNRQNLERILLQDYAIVASDASVQALHRQAGGGRPHPRCFDCFGYFLAEFVYARRLLPLELAVKKITSMPARRAGLEDRGTLTEGAFADLTLIDPSSLRATVSYEAPIRYPDGVELVVVNGAVVFDQGRHTRVGPGRFLTATRSG